MNVSTKKFLSFFVFTLPQIDAGHGAGIHAVGNALADIGDDRVSHSQRRPQI